MAVTFSDMVTESGGTQASVSESSGGAAFLRPETIYFKKFVIG